MSAAAGAGLLYRASKIYEVIVPYKSSDTQLLFTVEKDIGPTALVYYELPGVNMNRKDFIESKDSRAYTTLLNKVVCLRSEDRDSALSRRGNFDADFKKRINAVSGSDFAPCGLVALSMFTDNFTFYSVSSSDPGNLSLWEQLIADESDIALPADAKAFDKKISNSGGTLMVGSIPSWISPGVFYEHWKVWYRTPPAPHVRNLWAVIKGGLPRGQYAVEFELNSPIWEEWGVPVKNIVIAAPDTLGNRGAMSILGGICIGVGTLEFIASLLFAGLACFEIKPADRGKYQASATE